MYIPPPFRVGDRQAQYDFIARYGFGAVVSVVDGVPFATHLPLLLDRDRHTLTGHLARANPHWRCFDGSSESLVIFHGPHAFISPSWYLSAPAVPTWNYAAVHVYGSPALIAEPERVRRLLDAMVAEHDPAPRPVPDAYREQLRKAIVAFEIPIARIEAKFKLGQNRPEEDRASMLQHLEAGDAEARLLAEFIRGPLNRPA